MRESRESRRVSDRRSILTMFALVVAVLGASFAAGFYNPVRLGLDLQGGVEIILKAVPTGEEQLTGEELADAVEIVRSRVDELGTAEPEIRTQGTDQIAVSLPGVDDPERAVELVGSTAELRFYSFEENLAGNEQAYRNPYDLLKPEQARAEEKAATAEEYVPNLYLFDRDDNFYVAGPADSQERLLEQAFDAIRAEPEADRPAGWQALPEKLPKDWEVLEVPVGEVMLRGSPDRLPGIAIEEGGDFDRELGVWLLLDDVPALSGDNIDNAEASAQQGTFVTNINFDGEGAELFEETTAEIARRGSVQNFEQRFAIVLDDEIKSAPSIDFRRYPNGISGGSAQITGADSRDEASDLATVLKTGALPARFEVISRTRVSATLGEQSLRDGLLAGAAGLAVVMLYLILFYRMLGVVADLALLAFTAMLYALIVIIPITLTLPGIAGVILTIGIAADASIIVFERIREEYRLGRSVPQAMRNGYRRGLGTIVDASAVTLITATVLIVASVGSVRGFAIMLGMGTLLAIFTTITVTFALLATLGSWRPMQKRWVIGGSRKPLRVHIPWMRYRNHMIAFVLFGVVLAAGTIAAKGLNLGVDFTSGTRFDVALAESTDVESVRTTLSAVDPAFGRASIVETADAVGGEAELDGTSYSITVEQLIEEEGAAAATAQRDAERDVELALEEEFGLAEPPSVQVIGPTFGEQVLRAAIIAVVISLLLEVLYIWFRFELKFAFPVLFALLHDLLIATGAYALTGREFKSTTVAALLTILGYSLYDTVIVFDRVRENVSAMRKASFGRIVTASLNEVLTRSINTSVVVLLPVVALFLYGGETLQDFAFALMVGIAVGVYSSIVVASPLLAWIKDREPGWKKRREAEESRERRQAAATAAEEQGADTTPEPTSTA